MGLYSHPDSTYQIRFSSPSTELFDAAKTLPGFSNFNWKDKNNKEDSGIDTTKNQEHLKAFIELVNQYYSLEEIKNEIYEFLCIRKNENELGRVLNSKPFFKHD